VTRPGVWVSVVIPAYDEAARLPLTLDGWVTFFARQPYAAEVLVVDDGSRDDTTGVVQAFAAGHRGPPAIRSLTLIRNQGKGGAVKAGMLAAAGANVFYADADLNVAPEHLDPALAFLAAGYDVVAGQRRLRAYAATERSLRRVLSGALVQATRRVLVLPVIRDTQCGFKGFRAGAARAIFERARIRSFAFDVEVLYLAWRLGMRIKELPVDVVFRSGGTFDVSRHLGPFLGDIVAVRRHALAGDYGDLRPGGRR
jgi:glycosyltransferase involved in cell wall biosynthesis